MTNRFIKRADEIYAKAREEEAAVAAHTGMSTEEAHNLLNPDSESDSIPIIKKYLRSEGQRLWLNSRDLSIEDLLNGRFDDGPRAVINKIFADWNEKLGKHVFG